MAALLRVGLALVILVSATAGQEKCRTGCQGVKPHTFKFAEGTTYTYDYDGNIDLSLSSAEGQHSTTKVKATVLLTQQGQCNQVLRVQNLQITSGENKKYSHIADIEKPIILNFHDGHIEDVICTETSDSQNSLNIKRAIASAFQAALKHHGTEIDVFGSCPTEFSTRKESGLQVIKKTRNLNKCAHREFLKQDFMTTAFDMNSEIKTSPFLQGKYESEIKLKDGIPQLIMVTEDYLYVPFSNGNKGARADVVSTLKFIKTSKENPRVSCSIPRSIIFDDPHPIVSEKSTVGPLLNAIKETAKSIGLNVKQTTASKFRNVIKIMRASSKKDLAAVYSQVRSGAGFPNKDIGRQVFLDALYRVSTGEAVEVAIDIYKSHGLNFLESKLFFTSLNFIKHVTEDSLSAAAGLLSGENLQREAYLGIGSLASAYCRQHSCGPNTKGLNKILAALQAKLNSRPANREAETDVILALKAIRNAGRVNNPLASKIVEIAQDKQTSSRLRVAALEAYLADPCNDKFRDSGINILKDIQQDSEIRIKAYLAISQCPNGKVATAIKNQLNNEPSIQVGGFIVSSLATIRSSNNPDKALAKAQLGEIRTTKKFPMDFRQYSFNGEQSFDIDTLGMGNSLEANVIYSQKGFLPRSTSLNLTSEIFGYRYNFLEIDARQENLEKVMESYLGPSGKFRKESPRNLLAKGTERLKNLIVQGNERLRPSGSRQKREIGKNQIENFAKQITDKQSSLNKDLEVDFSVKLFGSELLFLSMTEDCRKLTPESLVDKLFDNFDSFKAKARNFDEALAENVLFLDEEVAYPTSLGFPIRLSVEGTSSSNLKTSGNLNFDDFMGGLGKFKFTFVPSVNVELVSRFVLDAAVVESGLSVIGNLYSSVGGAFEADLGNTETDFKLTLPIDKQEVLTVTHDIVFETRELGGQEVRTPVKFIQTKDFSVCLDQFRPFVGLTFCADLNQPNVGDPKANVLPYPLNGNSKLSVTIQKTGFGYFHIHESQILGGEKGVYEVVDTSGHPISSLTYEIVVQPNPSITLVFDSPIKKAKMQAALVRTSTEQYAIAGLTTDGLEYYIKLGAAYTESPTRMTFKPIMEYKAGQGPAQPMPYHIDGQIIVEMASGDGVKYIFDNVKMISPDRKPISIAGNIVRVPHLMSTELTLDDGDHKGTLKGKIQFEEQGLNVNAQLDTTFDPSSNFDLKYKIHWKDRFNIDSYLQLIHGADLSNKDHLFKLHNAIEREGEGDDLVFGTEHELSYARLGLDNKFKLKSSKKQLDLLLQAAYRNIKLGTELEVEVDKKTKGDLDFDLEMYGFDNRLEIELNRQVSGYKSRIHHKITVNGNSLQVSGEVKHLIEQTRADIAHDLVIKITSRPDLKWKSELKYTQNDIDTSIKVQSGQDVWIDGFLKANKAGNANGNLKIQIPGKLTANGQIKASKGAGTGSVLINFVEVQRKVKTEASFTVNDPTYNFDVTLYTNWEKDNSKKYRISTQNQVKSEVSIDSKNVLDILNQKTLVNFKLSHTGDINNFEQMAEYEITLPTEQYFAGKFNRKLKNDKGILNGQAFLSLEQRDNKNAPGKTLTLKGVGKDINPNEGVFDLTYNLSLDNGAGQTLVGELDLKKVNVKDEQHIDYNGKLYGSVLAETLDGAITVQYTPTRANYKISSSYGNKATLNIKGKYDLHESESKQPCTGEVSVDVVAPNALIRIVKFHAEGSVLEPNTEADNFKLKISSGLFVDDDGSQEGATLELKADADVDVGITHGKIVGAFAAQKLDPVTVNVGYEYEPNKKYQGDVSLQYTKDKTVKGSVDFQTPNNETLIYDIQVETPIENAKKMRLQGKATETNKEYKSESVFVINELKYVNKATVVDDEEKPWFDVELKYPNGKQDRFYAKLLRLTDDSFAGESKIILHMYDFTWDSNVDITVHDPEDFHIKAFVDSPKFKLNKISLQANTKDVQGAKKLIFNAKEAEKNIVNGQTTYKIRKEEGKIIIDGSGTITIYNEKKSGNFKVLYRELIPARDKEDGIQLTINSIVGNKAFDIEYLLTDEHFKYLTSYCIEKKECAHVEIEARDPNEEGPTVLLINVDLRPLGLSHEFGLKSETDLENYKHALDIHVVSNQFKYQYSELILPTESHFTLTTPKRTISLEGEINTPGDKEPLKGKIALYLNKKAKPNEKTALEFLYDETVPTKTVIDLKFTAPPLKKPLSLNAKLIEIDSNNEESVIVLDVLPTGNKKIIWSEKYTMDQDRHHLKAHASQSIDIQPLNYKFTEQLDMNLDETNSVWDVDYKLISLYQNKPVATTFKGYLDKTKATSKLTIHNTVIFDINSKLNIGDGGTTIDTDYIVAGTQPRSSHLEYKANVLKFVLYKTGHPNTKLELNSGLIPGSIADFRLNVQKEGKKIDLVHGSVKLDETDFGKSDYAIDSDNIKEYLIIPVKSLGQAVMKESSDALTSAVEDTKVHWQTIGNELKKNTPDYRPVIVYYEKELDALKEELVTDESLKQLGESVVNIVSAVASVTLDLIKTFNEFADQIFKSFYVQISHLWEIIAKDIVPRVRDFVSVVGEKVIAIFESVTDLMLGLLTRVTSFLDAHQKELKQIATTLSQLGKDIVRFAQKAYEELSIFVVTEVTKVVEEVKALPIAEDMENIIKEISAGKKVPEERIAEFKQHVTELKSKITKEKLLKLIDLIATFIEKKLRNEPTNEFATFLEIVDATIDALDEFIEELLEIEFDEEALKKLPIPSRILDTLPEQFLQRCSWLNRLLNGDIPHLSQLQTFANLNPRSWFVPFRKYALVVQGQHIFTFDGKHLTFPGKCSYLLARDVESDEFSIVGTYVNGALSELTFADKSETITLKKTGAVTFNGAASEFPVRGKDVVAYRTYTETVIRSNKGVRIYCDSDLTLCMFSVSGFYHSQLRGLLGNANAEPYDDYTLPKGNIVTSESDFGNAYKIGSCAAVKTVDHSTHHHAESCTKLFTESPELLICQPFVNPANFRQACDHGVAAKVPRTEEAMAWAYAAACSTKYVPVLVPGEYLKCENSDKPYNLYDAFSVKLPQKAADIVFAIDVTKENEEVYKDLVTTLGSSLIKDLADRGIKDVEYHVITYGGDRPEWPSHITTNGGKMTFKGKMPNLKFTEAPEEPDDIDVGHDGLNFFVSLIEHYIKELNLAIGNEPQSRAYLEAIEYPFRANAIKAVVAVSSSPCQKGEFHWIQKLRALLLRQPTINLNLITPLGKDCDFKVKDEKTTKNVIGFNKEGVFTFSEAKKKPTGNPDLTKDLHYDDFCSDFTTLSGGNVFVLDNFSKNKKLFTTTASYNIAESLTTVEQGLDCICLRDFPYGAKNRCHLVQSKRKPASNRKLLKG